MSRPKPRFGFVQGRLIQTPGPLQWFPQAQWEEEFRRAREVGADYIELIAERDHNPQNPIWSAEGLARMRACANENDLVFHAFCNDYVIDHPLPGSAETLEQNFRLIDQGAALGCEKYVLPLFEKSELSQDSADDFLEPLRAIAQRAARTNMSVLLETILTGRELISYLERLNMPNIAAVYDTGNRVAHRHDLPGDIRLLGDRIRHVHIKDKNANDQNVLLGAGLVNFKDVFEALSDIGYRGPFTFETQRGKAPLRTARYNMQLVDYFAAEASDAS